MPFNNTAPLTAKALGASYAKEIRSLVERGIEVVIPAGGLPNMLFGAQLEAAASPATVIDSIALAIKAAEMAVDLKRLNGTAASRASTFASPSPAAFEALGMGEPASRRKAK